MKKIMLITFLSVVLAACAPAQIATEDIQNTAIVIVQTDAALTQTALPTATLPLSTFTPTATIVYPTPSPLPTQPLIGMTPDEIQVEAWEEYQTELAKIILSGYSSTPFSGYALCEWEILGRANQEVYVWAVCDGVSVPAVIYLEADGGIDKVDVPGMNSDWGSDIRRMFPADVREKFNYYQFGRVGEMLAHLEYRKDHTEEPPLIVLSAMSAATPMPTQPPPPIFTPDVIQVERWKEYQAELAKLVLSDSGADFPFYETALCEWDILGRTGQEVYVWAVCSAPGIGGETPTVIHLETDGSIKYVEVPGHGSTRETNIQRMFPTDVQEKFDLYYSSSFYGRARDLRDHLQYRKTHLEEPPLNVLSITPMPTPTP